MIEKGKQISLEYSVFSENGNLVDSNVGEEPLIFNLGTHQILPALEEVIQELEEGSSRRVILEPDQAFGTVDPEAFREVEASAIPEELRYEGAVLGVQDERGNQYRIRIHRLEGEKAVIDFNHPLAGQTLVFEMKIIAVK